MTGEKCTFVTSKGEECRRKTSSGLCWQHTPLNICCSICIENVGRCKKFSLDCCTHVFHRQCISRWIKKGNETCPCCRRTISGYQVCVLGGRRYNYEDVIKDVELILMLLDEIML